jgi:hypothetical protein
MTADYANARCCAITGKGKRCTGGWSTAAPCTFAWDPVTGIGRSGPWIVLCHRHRRWIWGADGIRQGRRFPVVHRGWLGASNEYNYGTSVLSAPTGWVAARWWGKHSHETRFGQSGSHEAP